MARPLFGTLGDAHGWTVAAASVGADVLSVRPITPWDRLEQVHPSGGPGLRPRPGHGSFVDRVQLPVPGDALERVGPSIPERDTRAGHQIGDGAGDKHFAGLGRSRHPRADVDRDAGQLPTDRLDLPGVQANPDFDAQGADRIAHRARATDRAGGTGEGREEAITSGVDLAAAESIQLRPENRVVSVQQRVASGGPPVATPARSTRRCR